GRLLQQSQENPFGGVGQAVGELEPAQQQLGLVPVVTEAALATGRQQVGDGREVVLLVEVEQHFAVAGVVDALIRIGGERAAEQEAGKENQSPAHDHCHSRNTNSGCSLRCRSEIFSSSALGSWPLATVTVAARRYSRPFGPMPDRNATSSCSPLGTLPIHSWCEPPRASAACSRGE